MARLKIGNAIQFEAKLPIIGPGLIEQQTPEVTVEDLVKMVIEALPKTEASKEVDLSPIQNDLLKMDKEFSEAIEELSVKIDEQRHEIIVPEIQHITHIKDATPEILDKVEYMLDHSEEVIDIKLQQFQDTITALNYTIEKQKNHKYILYGLFILTLFFHFIK